MIQMLRSILGPRSGGIIAVDEKDGSISIYQIGTLDRMRIRLRNPETNAVVSVRHALNGLHQPTLYKAWNDSPMPELSGSIASIQFSNVPMMAPQTAHLFELGMYVGFRMAKLIVNKGLELDVKQETIPADEMDRVLKQEMDRRGGSQNHP